MTVKAALLSATAPFAHLLGRGAAVAPVASAAAEDDDKKKDRDARRARKAEESDDDYAKRMSEEDKREEAEDKKDEPDASDGDDDEDKEKAVKAAVVSERARCAAIFSAKSAGVCTALAATLAFTTDMSAADAIVSLDAAALTPAPTGRSSLAARVAAAPKVTAPGTDAVSTATPGGEATALAGKIIAAAASVRPAPKA